MSQNIPRVGAGLNTILLILVWARMEGKCDVRICDVADGKGDMVVSFSFLLNVIVRPYILGKHSQRSFKPQFVPEI